MDYNQFSDEPILATLADLPEQDNPYRSPQARTNVKTTGVFKKAASSLSYAFHYLTYATLTVIGFVLSGLIVIPEFSWMGWLGLALGLVSFASLVVLSRSRKSESK